MTNGRAAAMDDLVARLPPLDRRVLLLAPAAREAEPSAAILAEARLECAVCHDAEEFCREQARGAGVVLVAEGALPPAALEQVVAVVRRQPAWSDLPFLLLTSGGAADPPAASAVAQALTNTMPLDLPVRPGTLLSAVRAALRARARQYQVRDQLAARQRAEQAVEAERAFLRQVIDTTPSMVFVKDEQGRFLLANAALARAYGTTVDGVVGRSDADFNANSAEVAQFVADDRDVMVTRREKLIAEEPVTLATGEVRWFSTIKVPLVDPDGTCTKMLGVATDITLRRDAERALRASEERYRALVLASSPALYRMSADWRELRQLTDARGFIAAVPDDERARRGWLETYIHPEDRARVTEAVATALRTQGVFELEHRVLRPDGSHGWVLSRAVPLRDDAGEIVEWFGAASDIHERKVAEEALRDANRQLEDANLRLAEADRRKDEFLAMLAHELRNPLAPIRHAAQILRLVTDDAPGRERQRDVIDRQRDVIDRQVTHMARLLDDLLEVSRITRGKIDLKRQRVALETVLAQAVETAQPLIEGRGHTLAVERPREALEVEGDPDRLVQIVGNLLTNAAKFTPEGGRIWLEAGREDGLATIRVRDSGIGIAPEVLPTVFDVFIQADRGLGRAQGGLGLGLSLVRSLVQMHGGRVEAHSAGAGRGSEFVVRLPLLAAPRAPAVEPGEARGAAPAPGARRRVLVVDDTVDAAGSLAELLALWGHTVRTAFDGATALEEARAFRPDVVLLDIGMPDMDGFETARRLGAEHGPEAMVLVAVTGYGQEDDRRRSREAGFRHHLVKPLSLGALSEILAASPAREP